MTDIVMCIEMHANTRCKQWCVSPLKPEDIKENKSGHLKLANHKKDQENYGKRCRTRPMAALWVKSTKITNTEVKMQQQNKLIRNINSAAWECKTWGRASSFRFNYIYIHYCSNVQGQYHFEIFHMIFHISFRYHSKNKQILSKKYYYYYQQR